MTVYYLSAAYSFSTAIMQGLVFHLIECRQPSLVKDHRFISGYEANMYDAGKDSQLRPSS
jgi:hypothetical protein